jgi:hypothetical protein
MNPRLSIDIFFICNFEHLPLAKNDLFMVLLLFHSWKQTCGNGVLKHLHKNFVVI